MASKKMERKKIKAKAEIAKGKRAPASRVPDGALYSERGLGGGKVKGGPKW